MSNLSLFEQWMFEAPGDDPAPDVPAEPIGAPDMPEDTTPANDPPDLGGDDAGIDIPPDFSGEEGGDEPPEFGDEGDDTFDDTGEDQEQDINNMGLDDKVSAVLNLNLYQSYLELLTQIGTQITSMKNNSELLYAITPDIKEIVKSIKTLDENIRLYIDNKYMNERYESNLLFYNKCKNLNKLLNDKFNAIIHKELKASSNH